VTRVGALDVRGKRVAVALAGDHPNPALTDTVERGGGEVYAFAPYHYRLPEDLGEIGAFIHKVLAGEVGWLVFTTPPQVSILMDAAEKLGLRERLVEATNRSGAVAAVGPVTARELARYDVKVSVRPTEENETMAGLVNAIEGFLSKP
jgi:uroporphyrinogen-III synthase